MFDDFKLSIRTKSAAFKWRKRNKHNFTKLRFYCDIDLISVGNGTYGDLYAESFGVDGAGLKIGHYCSIGQNVRFIMDGEHNYKHPSTYPFKVRYLNYDVEALCKGPITVEDDVWIGERAIILSGVTIGQGAVIGAGSVVTKDVPPYAVYAGDKVVKYRFSEDQIAKMIKLDYSSLSVEEVRENLDLMYKELDDSFFESDFYLNHLK